MPKTKALVLFSGGLDSLLAIKVLELQDIEVTGLCFASNFFSCAKARETAAANNIKLKVVDISDEILAIVKNPHFGYGKNMNPCIDCHSFMIKKAAEHLQTSPRSSPGIGEGEREVYDILATGEVLGQRPFSQNKDALERVKKAAGIEVLRPLSAKLLLITKYEEEGLANRGRLLDISGRTRERQFELAKTFNIKEFPSPAGGCLLTDPEFSERLIKMLNYWPACSKDDIELLKNGRIFWLRIRAGKALIIVGRNAANNENLEKLARSGDIMVELYQDNGPTTLIRGAGKMAEKETIIKVAVPESLNSIHLEPDKIHSLEEILENAALLTGFYATKVRGKNIDVKIKKI
jgi:tRNA-uridine 2-sulfurtransferase